MNCLFCGRELKMHIRTSYWFILTNYCLPETLYCELGSNLVEWKKDKLDIIDLKFRCGFRSIKIYFSLDDEKLSNRVFEKSNTIISGGFEI